MNGRMERYRASLAETAGPVSLRDCPQVKMDLRGLMAYARERGVQPVDLSHDEKVRFVDVPPSTHLPLMG